MTIVLLRFVVILLVVILGFAMALFPLLRDAGTFTFPEILLLLFKTLLGDVEAFDEFSDSARNRYSPIGNTLLVLYLVIMTIMLLNLLIAVLSTAHAKVETNADKDLEVSKVRVVEHYRLIVALDILPAPFNLVQFVLTLPFTLMRQQPARRKEIQRKIDQTVGQVFFWLVLSPVVVIVGTLLWVASSVYSIRVPAADLVSRVPSALTLTKYLSRGHLLPPLISAYFGLEPLLPLENYLRGGPRLTWFARGFLRLYSFLFPGRESLQSAKHVANWNAVRLHIGVGGVCALGAPFCLLFLWLREPCLQIFQVIVVSMMYLRGKWRTPHPPTQDGVEATGDGSQLSSNDDAPSTQDGVEATGDGSQLSSNDDAPSTQDGVEATGDGSQLSSNDDADAQVHRMLKSAGVRASEFQKYLENPIIDPEVRPDEVELGTTVEHMKLLRNLLEKRFSDLGEGLEKKFNDRVGVLDKKVDDLGESLDKKVGEHGDCQENNLNSFKTDVLEILRGHQRLMGK